MTKALKQFRLSIFTFIEVVFVFAVITIVLSMNMGYAEQIRAGIKNEQSATILYYLNGITILAVFVTALGTTGIQLIHLYRRSGEIGLRKAVGAKDSDIVALVLKDTLLSLLIPALCGVTLGAALAANLSDDVFGLNAKIDIFLIAGSALILLIFAFLSGILPAAKAVQTDPADVLRRKGISRRENPGRKYNIAYLLITAAIIIGGISINHNLEAAYREDMINTAGAPPAITQQAPAFSFEDGNGKVISSEELKDKNYCLLIWEEGCFPSISLLNELSNLISEGRLESDDVYAICLDTSIKRVEEYISANHLSVAPYADHKKSTKWAFNAGTTPALYVMDKDGIITARILGWSEAAKEYLLNNLPVN